MKATPLFSVAPNAPWKTGDFEFRLKPKEAKPFIAKGLDTFKDKRGAPPKEFFIHGRKTFNEEEWNAFKDAAPVETNVVGVRIKETKGESKLFRDGDYPVMRGTAIILDERNAVLWMNGFVPRLDTYIGPETPNPLSITVLRSTGEPPDIRNVLADIMGLTKINYNACNYNDGLPVTIRFANKVGDVLTMGRLVTRKNNLSSFTSREPTPPCPEKTGRRVVADVAAISFVSCVFRPASVSSRFHKLLI